MVDYSDTWYAEIHALRRLADPHPGGFKVFDWAGARGATGQETEQNFATWNQHVDELYRSHFGSELTGREWATVLSKLTGMGLVIPDRGPFGSLGWQLTDLGHKVLEAATHSTAPTQTIAPRGIPATSGTEQARKLRVYIAHSHNDNERSTPLEQGLRVRDFATWYDINDIPYGSSLIEKMRYGLMNCDVFLLVWSESANGSKWIQEEYEEAVRLLLDGRIRSIISVVLDDTPLPFPLGTKKYVRWTTEQPLEEFLDAVSAGLKLLS